MLKVAFPRVGSLFLSGGIIIAINEIVRMHSKADPLRMPTRMQTTLLSINHKELPGSENY